MQVNTDTTYYPRLFSAECAAFANKIRFAPNEETVERIESYPSLPRYLRIFLQERLNGYLMTAADGKNDASDEAIKAVIRNDLLTKLDMTSAFDHFMGFNDRVRCRLFESNRRKILYGVFAFTSRCEGPPRMVHGGCIGTAVDVVLGIVGIHFLGKRFLTKRLNVTYVAPIPYGVDKLVGVRCWLSEVSPDSNRITVMCDVVSLLPNSQNTLKLHARGIGNFVAVDSPLLPSLPNAFHLYDRPHLLTYISQTYEELYGDHPHGFGTVENREKLRKFPIPHDRLPKSCPRVLLHSTKSDAAKKNNTAEEEEETPTEFNFSREMGPELVDFDRRGIIDLHTGQHFDFIPDSKHSTVAIRFWYLPKANSMAGAVFFGDTACGPEPYIHGGAIFAAFDSFLGDSVFRLFGWGYTTASLTVRYLKSISMNSTMFFRNLRFEKREANSRKVVGMVDLVDSNEPDRIHAIGSCVFATKLPVALSFDQAPVLMKKMRDNVREGKPPIDLVFNSTEALTEAAKL